MGWRRGQARPDHRRDARDWIGGTDVTANCFHPGFVATGFNRNNGFPMRVGMAITRPFARSALKGAETLVWLVDSEAAGETSGGYFFDERLVTPSAAAQDRDAARRLWQVSEAQVQAASRWPA